MNTLIIRSLLLIGVLAFAFNSNGASVDTPVVPYQTVQSITEQGDIADVIGSKSPKLHFPAHKLHDCGFLHMTAPVQESVISVRRVEYSRTSETYEDVFSLDVFSPIQAYRVQTVAVNDRHDNSALCRCSRFYIYKFGAILI